MTTQQHIDKFHDTVNILVKAYLNDTLVHGNCVACAVGNIVAEKKKYKIRRFGPGSLQIEWRGRNNREVNPKWDLVFISDGGNQMDDFQSRYPSRYKGLAKKEIDSTGYTWQQLAKIEASFESVTYSDHPPMTQDEEMFAGLMAVVDVLAEIHGVDLSVKESAKLQFVKP